VVNRQEHHKREHFREAFIRLLKENGIDFDEKYLVFNPYQVVSALCTFPPVTQAALGVIIIQLLRSFYTSVFLFYDGQYLLNNLLHCPLDFGVKPQIS